MAAVPNIPIVVDKNGVAYIEGTTTKVIEVAVAKETSGLTPEQLQTELPHLSRAQVYAALAYYYAHQAELDAEIERRYPSAEGKPSQAGVAPFARRSRKTEPHRPETARSEEHTSELQ